MYYLLRQNPRFKKTLKDLGGPKGLPILGNTLSFFRPHEEFLPMIEAWIEQHGRVFGVWIGNIIPYVMVADATNFEKLLSTTNHINKGKHDYSLLHEWLGTGLLTAPRSKWSVRRKMLTPSFHFKILEDFMPIFNEQATILLDCLTKEKSSKTFDIFPYITRCTLDIICETAMGKKINTQISQVNKDYFDAVNGMCEILLQKNTQPWLRFPPIYYMSSVFRRERTYLKKLKGFTLGVIKSKQADRALQKSKAGKPNKESEGDNVYGGKERKAFLDLLLDASENGNILTDADIREEVDTFMFEGHDTTAASLGWTIMLLSAHPECQRKVQEELDEIFQDDPSRDVTTADVAKMKYLECCVKESLRLYPSVPIIMREVDYDIKLEDGRVIPEGATAMIGIYFNHRDPVHFPEPKKFNPERFSTESLTNKRHNYCFVPFSAGPRNCIGQKFALLEEKVVLAKLFRTYTMEATERIEDVIPVPDVILRPKNGVNVALHKRS